MKTKIWLPLVSAALSISANASSPFEKFAPHLGTNCQILWLVATNELPSRLPIYKATTRIFSVAAISNAIALSPLAMPTGISASTNSLSFSEPPSGCAILSLNVLPAWGSISFHNGSEPRDVTAIRTPEEVSEFAWDLAARFELPTAELVERPESRRPQTAQNGALASQICSRETFLSRKMNGIEMRDLGLRVTLGSHGQVRGFYISWPNLEQQEMQPITSPDQIILCIRARMTILSPSPEGGFDFGILKELEGTRKFTIKHISPIYGEGRYGTMPDPRVQDRYFAPYAELEAVAELERTNLIVHLLSPILSNDVVQLLNPSATSGSSQRAGR